jgi:hypothetical protein
MNLPAPIDCPRCHATPRPARLTLRYLFARLREETIGSERGLALTAWRLLVAPRAVVEAYLHGDDRRYFGPVKYFLVATALSILLMPNLPLLDSAIAETLAKNALVAPAAAQDWVADWNGLLYAPLLLMLALATRVFFRDRGWNLAEHLVVATYGWSQMVVVATVALGIVAVLKAFGLRGLWLLPLLFASAAYWFWYCRAVFRIRRLADWARCFVCVPFAMLCYLVAMLIVVGLWVAATRP